MTQNFPFLIEYLRYYFSAQTKYAIHSPFVFELYKNVLEDKKPYPDYLKIERYRSSQLLNKEVITIYELGAGTHGRYYKAVKDIIKSSSKQKKYCRLLYLLAAHFKPKTMIELGTSFGISTMYQAAAAPDAKMITIDGNSLILTIATQVFKDKGFTNIKTMQGLFEERFPEALSEFEWLDWLFIDGNHRKESTLRYFNMATPKLHQQSVVIIDDINWSDEMKEAWTEIKNHPSVTVSIDLFMMGIVFFDSDLSNEHFVLRY